MQERPRYLTRPGSTRGGTTTDPRKKWAGEPEAVDDEWAASIAADAKTRHEDFTMRRAAEHGVRVVLEHEGLANSSTIKARIAQALGCDVRTVERAADAMPDLLRQRGRRSATTWSLFTGDTKLPISRGLFSTSTLRDAIVARVQGERQAAFASEREIAVELIADEWQKLMGASEVLEPPGDGRN
jgi:hypothetical protein